MASDGRIEQRKRPHVAFGPQFANCYSKTLIIDILESRNTSMFLMAPNFIIKLEKY
jgi:hypothetical protein